MCFEEYNISKEKIKHVEKLLLEGHTLQQVADVYGCSRENMRQFRNRHLKHLNKNNSGKGKVVREAQQKRLEDFKEAHGRDAWLLDEIGRAQNNAFTRKKQNCKWSKWEFTVKRQDLIWPTHCPILGIELDWFAEKVQENSPSFDRIDSSKGYVKGNVAIISWRANRIKNDGNSDEHLKIAAWLKQHSL